MERSVDSGFIKRATEVVVSRLDQEGFSGNELAGSLGLSREQTHRKIKQYTTLSSGKFIRSIRLLKACVFLMEGKYSISEISYKLGFDTPSYFNKCFREELGTSPGELKRKGQIDQLKDKELFSFYQLPEIKEVLQSKGIRFEVTPIKKSVEGPQWLATISHKKIWLILGVPILLIFSSMWYLNQKKSRGVVDLGNNFRIAVLPFSNQTGDSSMGQVGDIASSWISGQIADLEGAQSVPYFTVKQYQSYIGILPEDPNERPTFYELVGARYFISGYYFLKGQKIYFDTHLVDAHSQEPTYDLPIIEGPRDSIMEVIEELRLKIAGLITNLEEVKLGKLKPPNYEAYQFYIKGLSELSVGFYPSDALKYFEKASELEPDFVMPKIFLTWFYPERKRDSVLQSIEAISTITDYERRVYLELYYTYTRNYPEALKVSLRSLKDYPQDYYFNMEAAHTAKSQFYPYLAIDILSQIHDPLNSNVGLLWHYFKVWNYTESLNMLGRYEETLAYLESIPKQFYNPSLPGLFIKVYVKLDKSKEDVEALIHRFAQSNQVLEAEYNTAAAYEFGLKDQKNISIFFAKKAVAGFQSLPEKKGEVFDLVDALYLSGDLNTAKDYVRQNLTVDPDNQDLLIYLAHLDAALGKEKEAFENFNKMEDNLIVWRRHEYEYQSDYLKARLYALLGKKQESMKLLNKAMEKGQLKHFYDFDRDIFLKFLFDYHPFQQMVKPREYTDITDSL
ncbi:MAG: helix-turn-helix domain-containing protein [Cyclobacteriaceae bacterium]